METTAAKKMLVVPPELLTRLAEHKATVPAGSLTSAESLDAEMRHIMNDKSLRDVDAKWKLYQQTLRRFLQRVEGTRAPIHIPIYEDRADEDPDADAVVDRARNAEALVEELVATFSKAYKSDARNLLRHLVRSGVVTWDADGTVIIRGTKVQDSNIVDVLNHIVRIRNRPLGGMPPGWREVMYALHDTNVPSEYINNPVAREYLGRPQLGTLGPSVTPGTLPSRFRSDLSRRLEELSTTADADTSRSSFTTSTPIAHRTRARADKRPTYDETTLSRWEPFKP